MLNEVNMDLRIPGLPHSIVKHAQSTSNRDLIQKIENHPDRHALQQDLRQNQAYNPFSPESKRTNQDVGNVELFELLETDTKTQCIACLSHWSEGIVYCTCGHLLKRNSGQSRFHWIHIGPYFNSRIRHQEGKTSRPQIWETSRKQRILFGQLLEKEMHKEGLQRNPWPILARSYFPWANDWKQSRWRSLSCVGRSCRWRSHLPYVRRRILLLQEQLVDLSQ